MSAVRSDMIRVLVRDEELCGEGFQQADVSIFEANNIVELLDKLMQHHEVLLDRVQTQMATPHNHFRIEGLCDARLKLGYLTPHMNTNGWERAAVLLTHLVSIYASKIWDTTEANIVILRITASEDRKEIQIFRYGETLWPSSNQEQEV